MLLLGVIIILIVSICVKLFDSKIRPYHWRKVGINVLTLSGLLFIIVGIIQLIIG